MKTKFLVIAALGLIFLLVAGGAIFFLATRPNNQTAGNTSNTSTDNNNGVEQVTESITDLLGLNRNVQCSYTRTESDGTVAGTLYVAGKKMSGDFTVNDADGTSHGNMISDGEYYYVWGNASSGDYAIKMKMTDEDVKDQAEAFDFQKDADMNCTAWLVDNSKFNLPAGVEFQDLSALLNSNNTGTSKATQCAYCNTLEGEMKSQCLGALQCN